MSNLRATTSSTLQYLFKLDAPFLKLVLPFNHWKVVFLFSFWGRACPWPCGSAALSIIGPSSAIANTNDRIKHFSLELKYKLHILKAFLLISVLPLYLWRQIVVPSPVLHMALTKWKDFVIWLRTVKKFFSYIAKITTDESLAFCIVFILLSHQGAKF